ncbi:MAG: hypothetical protein IPI19_10980 [Ignavibacteriales bacterium]|nr:hypothetical protein [Ignavibacteriales bacterium]
MKILIYALNLYPDRKNILTLGPTITSNTGLWSSASYCNAWIDGHNF